MMRPGYLFGLLLSVSMTALAGHGLAAPSTPTDVLKNAQELFDRADYKSAVSAYRKFLSDNKKDPRAQAVQLMIAESLYESQYVRDKESFKSQPGALAVDKKILQEYEAAADIDPYSPLAESAQFRINEMLYNSQDYPRTEQAWTDFLRRYPDSYL
ncbi:MAG: hypothetical protein AABZ44_05815, partial [Elusimicrobiota bacterium]